MSVKKNLPAHFCAGVLLAGVLFCGCHTTKNAVKGRAGMPAAPGNLPSSEAGSKLTSGAIRENLDNNTLRYQTFSARAKLDIETPQGSQKGIASFIRMRKDSAVWISVRPVFGIEMVRVLITPDSVKMINFLKRTITLRSADSMQKLLHIPADFGALQNLIAGNPLFLTDSLLDIHADSSGTMISFACKKKNFVSRYRVFAGSYLLQQYRLLEEGASAETRYSNEAFDAYKLIDNRRFSTERHLVIHAGKETKVDIKFNHVEFDKPMDFPFPMSDKFTLK